MNALGGASMLLGPYELILVMVSLMVELINFKGNRFFEVWI